jgi:hypothetical protein
MEARNPYVLLGLALALAGVCLALVAHFLLESTPLSALGVSAVILGAVSLALGRTRPRVSPEVSALLLETGLENVSTIIEELGLRSKAIYLPGSVTDGRPQALIPLHSNSSVPTFDKPLPRRLIVKYGPQPDDIGLVVTTPGTATLQMLESKPGPSAEELQDALTAVFEGMLDVADGVTVAVADKTITIDVLKPRLEYRNIRYYECLGSPIASIAAGLAAEALGKPVRVESEESGKGNSVIRLDILA